jgi:predicted transcriptional regulator|tara:strand:- start:2323 stop:2607 length:285 start_codon:yes stop_codon:yes gene_type:complete
MTKMSQELIYRQKSQEVLKVIYGNGFREMNSSRISRQAGCTYSHGIKVMNDLQDLGLVVRRKKDGRSKILELTSKGRHIARLLNEIREVMEDDN